MKAVCRSCKQEVILTLTEDGKCWVCPSHYYKGYWCDESGCYVCGIDEQPVSLLAEEINRSELGGNQKE